MGDFWGFGAGKVGSLSGECRLCPHGGQLPPLADVSFSSWPAWLTSQIPHKQPLVWELAHNNVFVFCFGAGKVGSLSRECRRCTHGGLLPRERNYFEKRNSFQKKELPSEKEFFAEKGIEELLAEKGFAFRKRNRLQKNKLGKSLQKKELPSGKGIPLKNRN